MQPAPELSNVQVGEKVWQAEYVVIVLAAAEHYFL